MQELRRLIKSKPHSHMEASLLDCLVINEILVDEGKARAVDASTKKTQQIHDQMQKLRKKGKLREYKEMKATLMQELKETDAIGLDLGHVAKTNNQIIKETLAIYFLVLKRDQTSPLLRSVFLGLPQFAKYVNVEIVWDLINVLREYFSMQLGDTRVNARTDDEQACHNSMESGEGISSILAGLLCAF